MMREKIAVLERMPRLECVAPQKEEALTTSDFLGDLPQKAANLLGYDELQRRLQCEAEKREGEFLKKNERFKFRKTLSKLRILPFTKNSVERYQEQKLRKFNGIRPLVLPFGCSFFLVSVVAVIALTGLIISGEGKSVSAWHLGMPNWFLLGGLWVLAVLATSFYMMIANSVWSWQSASLKDYAKPVPELVLMNALKIKEAFPKAEFYVCELAKGGIETKDPFLIVCYADEQYFIDVWDEPEFDYKKG